MQAMKHRQLHRWQTAGGSHGVLQYAATSAACVTDAAALLHDMPHAVAIAAPVSRCSLQYRPSHPAARAPASPAPRPVLLFYLTHWEHFAVGKLQLFYYRANQQSSAVPS